ncbi:MAG: DNA cytosine methyltransferase [Methanobacteriota archaeon]
MPDNAMKFFKYKTLTTGVRVCEEESVYTARRGGALLRKRNKPRLIDLFAGAGGLTLGFTSFLGHNFDLVWANDFDSAATRTYNANFAAKCEHRDILEIVNGSAGRVPKADVVIGGPPCQGFSLLSKNRKNDPRKHLWRPFLEVVAISDASIFLIENVPEILGSPEYRQIVEVARRMGFKLVSAKLCAADYGVPQTRWRAFILGWKHGDPSILFPPKKTHYNPRKGYLPAMSEKISDYTALPKPWRTVRDAIGDLPIPVGTEIRNDPPPLDLHFGRNPTEMSKKRYRAIPKEGMNRFDLQHRAPHLTPKCWIRKKSGGTDLFGRLWWDRPAFTIRTEFFKPEKGRYLHPQQHRPITHREAARLQTFPDDFIFEGSKIEIAKQIGNAVPPLLAARLADSVYAIWLTERTKISPA